MTIGADGQHRETEPHHQVSGGEQERGTVQPAGAADGSIIPATITDHIIHIRTTCWFVHAEVMGIANGEPISPIRVARNPR